MSTVLCSRCGLRPRQPWTHGRESTPVPAPCRCARLGGNSTEGQAAQPGLGRTHRGGTASWGSRDCPRRRRLRAPRQLSALLRPRAGTGADGANAGTGARAAWPGSSCAGVGMAGWRRDGGYGRTGGTHLHEARAEHLGIRGEASDLLLACARTARHGGQRPSRLRRTRWHAAASYARLARRSVARRQARANAAGGCAPSSVRSIVCSA